MIKRLRLKFILVTMVPVMVLLVLVLWMVFSSTRATLETDTLRSLEAAAAQPPGRPGSGQAYTVPCFTLEINPHGQFLVSGSTYYDLTDQALLYDIYRAAADQQDKTGLLKQYHLRFYREDTPGGSRYAFADISGHRRALTELVKNCVLIGLLGFGGLLALSIVLAFWAVRPVEKAWQQQRQFVADASHELKTPLTVILTNAELLQAEGYPPEEKQRFGENILVMSRQMRNLVEGLLQLARVDNGQLGAPMTRLALSTLVEDGILPFEPLYFESGLTLESHIQPGLTLPGSETGLRQVLEILLDNGRKYAAPGSTVTVTLAQQARGKVLLTVKTPGKPLTNEQCVDIFKRFYRVDAARSNDGSYGLGLSIAHRIVREHGGRIWAQGTEEGNCFFVSLPG